MAEVIKVPQMREVFYSLSIGIDVLTVSKKTGVAPRNLAYMYKKSEQTGLFEMETLFCMETGIGPYIYQMSKLCSIPDTLSRVYRSKSQECSDICKGTRHTIGICKPVDYTFRKFGYKF